MENNHGKPTKRASSTTCAREKAHMMSQEIDSDRKAHMTPQENVFVAVSDVVGASKCPPEHTMPETRLASLAKNSLSSSRTPLMNTPAANSDRSSKFTGQENLPATEVCVPALRVSTAVGETLDQDMNPSAPAEPFTALLHDMLNNAIICINNLTALADTLRRLLKVMAPR